MSNFFTRFMGGLSTAEATALDAPAAGDAAGDAADDTAVAPDAAPADAPAEDATAGDADATPDEAEADADTTDDADDAAGDTPEGDVGADAPAPDDAQAADARTEFRAMVDAFGEAFAARAYADGLFLSAAALRRVEALQAENDELRQRIAAAAHVGEDAPAEHRTAEPHSAGRQPGEGEVSSLADMIRPAAQRR